MCPVASLYLKILMVFKLFSNEIVLTLTNMYKIKKHVFLSVVPYEFY